MAPRHSKQSTRLNGRPHRPSSGKAMHRMPNDAQVAEQCEQSRDVAQIDSRMQEIIVNQADQVAKTRQLLNIYSVALAVMTAPAMAAAAIPEGQPASVAIQVGAVAGSVPLVVGSMTESQLSPMRCALSPMWQSNARPRSFTAVSSAVSSNTAFNRKTRSTSSGRTCRSPPLVRPTRPNSHSSHDTQTKRPD